MTNEQLADDCLLAAKVLQDIDSFETGQAILRDAAARIREMDAALKPFADKCPDAPDMADDRYAFVPSATMGMFRAALAAMKGGAE